MLSRKTPMKRTPMKRSTPLRAAGPARAAVPALRQRKCAQCGEKFQPRSSMTRWCSTDCGAALAMARLEKAKTKAARTDRATTRVQLEALKTVPQLKREAQQAFNAFIRARDRAAGWACICCGKPLQWDVPGGAVDAGHYRSTGSADHMRFNEANCHAQRADCNRFGAGRVVDYRIGLIARIGLAAVEALEANNSSIKWGRDELRATRDMYRRRAREMTRTAGRPEFIEGTEA
jgi:hypothetical protein